MVYMSAGHLFRIYNDYMGWTLDFSGPQMLLVIKLTSFAYTYYDGMMGLKKDEKKASVNSRFASVQESRRAQALFTLPTLVEFYGYVFCFTTLLAGPAFEMREYLDVTSGRKFEKKKGDKVISSRTKTVLMKLISGVMCMALFSVGSGT